MLDDLRSVPWKTALALFVGGAAAAILLALVINSGGGSAATLNAHRASGKAVGGKPRVKPAPPTREAESPPGEALVIPLPRMVGQRFMVGLREAAPSAKLLEDARRGEIGGVVMFAENSTPAAVGVAVGKLQAAAAAGGNPPLLIAIDQEGGPVNRFRQGPPRKPLSVLSADAALGEGAATGSYLRRYGINVDLAPVVDLGLPGSFVAAQGRTISADPKEVTAVAGAFAGGLEQTNVMPVAKHFPGLGGASVNTDEGQSVVEAGLGGSLRPYRALIGSQVPAIMVSTAIYTKLDPSHGAAWSGKIVAGLLRRRLRFNGVVISDDLSSPGVAASLSTPSAVTAAAKAGVDVLMIVDPNAFRAAYETALKAAEEGRISKRNLISSYGRILSAKGRLGN